MGRTEIPEKKPLLYLLTYYYTIFNTIYIFTMWQSCPPSKDEILSFLRTQYDKLRTQYNKLNNELEEAQLMQESKHKGIIKSLKQQRTYLVRKIDSLRLRLNKETQAKIRFEAEA